MVVAPHTTATLTIGIMCSLLVLHNTSLADQRPSTARHISFAANLHQRATQKLTQDILRHFDLPLAVGFLSDLELPCLLQFQRSPLLTHEQITARVTPDLELPQRSISKKGHKRRRLL